jgi:hypothetical protein
MAQDTPFMQFWAALNQQLRSEGKHEIGFGAARAVWDSALVEARHPRNAAAALSVAA